MAEKKLLVMKFGGTSVKDAEMVKTVAGIVKKKIDEGYSPILVCSAMGKTTNKLIDAGERALGEGLAATFSPKLRPSAFSTTVTKNGVEEGAGLPPPLPNASSFAATSPQLQPGGAASGSDWRKVIRKVGETLLTELREHHREAAAELQVSTELLDQIEDLLDGCASLLTGIRLLRDISSRTRDTLMSYGERMSVRMVAGHLQSVGIEADAVDSWDIGLITGSGCGSAFADKGAELLPDVPERIQEALGCLREPEAPVRVPVVTGFIAKDLNGVITTLGRGGSDFSAAVIGAAVGAAEIEIWTDVDGIFTSDPRIVPEAFSVPSLTFLQAAELAYFGAKVLHPRTIQPAMGKGIPVRVKNTFNAEHPGTVIVQSKEKFPRQPGPEKPRSRMMSEEQIQTELGRKVTGITHKSGVIMMEIYSEMMLGQHGFLSKVFEIFGDTGISVDVIATSEVSVSLTLDQGVQESAVVQASEKLRKFADVKIDRGMSLLTVICNTTYSSSILGVVCNAFHELGIIVEMVSCGASKINISFVIRAEKAELERSLRAIHALFFAEKKQIAEFIGH
mmetsp:Transcript_48257/g.95236  ORF Transcript_48257/g.95236 Transcript_48257/m.95236 type:complete len:564 (+) Transcript_48257:283-1974(+)